MKEVRARDSERDSQPLYSRALVVGKYSQVFDTFVTSGLATVVTRERKAMAMPIGQSRKLKKR
jgi:hypothetical protein